MVPSNSSEPETPAGKSKSGRFRQVFWLAFLVISLGYAWYSFYAPANDVAWAEDFTAAQQQAVETDKPMILFFTGAWCSPCQIMKRQVWADDQVASKVNAEFVPVTIDVDNPGAAATLSRYGVHITPTTILTDPAGSVLQEERGGMSKADFLDWLGKAEPAALEGR